MPAALAESPSAWTVEPGAPTESTRPPNPGWRARRAARRPEAPVPPSAEPSNRDPRGARRYWWAGWRDGRACLPSLDEGAAPPDRILMLHSLATRRAEQRWMELLEQTRAQRLELATLDDELARAEARRDRAIAELTEHQTEGPKQKRQFGEAQMPAELVALRRSREHDRRTTALTEKRSRRTNYVHLKRQRRAELTQALSAALHAAQALTRADLSHYDGLAAHYLRGAVRTHFDPEALGQQAYRFRVPRPDWVQNADLQDFLRAAGAESEPS